MSRLHYCYRHVTSHHVTSRHASSKQEPFCEPFCFSFRIFDASDYFWVLSSMIRQSFCRMLSYYCFTLVLKYLYRSFRYRSIERFGSLFGRNIQHILPTFSFFSRNCQCWTKLFDSCTQERRERQGYFHRSLHAKAHNLHSCYLH